MAFGNLSGIKSARYSVNSDMSASVTLGEIREDSPGPKTEISETPEASGQKRYAGGAEEKVIHVTDMSKFAAMETLMKANTEIYTELTDLESNVKVFGPSKVKVWQVTQIAPGETAYFAAKMNWRSV